MPDQNLEEEMSLSKIIGKIVADHDQETMNSTAEGTIVKDSNSQIKPKSDRILSSTRDLWTGLSKYHWPQLLSYYNTSLLGR